MFLQATYGKSLSASSYWVDALKNALRNSGGERSSYGWLVSFVLAVESFMAYWEVFCSWSETMEESLAMNHQVQVSEGSGHERSSLRESRDLVLDLKVSTRSWYAFYSILPLFPNSLAVGMVVYRWISLCTFSWEKTVPHRVTSVLFPLRFLIWCARYCQSFFRMFFRIPHFFNCLEYESWLCAG